MLDTLAGTEPGTMGHTVLLTLTLLLTGLLIMLAGACLRLRRQNARLTLALSNTPQGLCMWDSSGRLLICNERYVSMYGMSPDMVRPGMTLRQILAHRAEIGNFTGNPDQYIADIKKRILAGKERYP